MCARCFVLPCRSATRSFTLSLMILRSLTRPQSLASVRIASAAIRSASFSSSSAAAPSATLPPPSVARAELWVSSRAEWREWLLSNHDRVREIWLRMPLKSSGHSGVSYEAAVEESLCFGWIDSTMARSQQDGWKRQRFSPRTLKSQWSKLNQARAERLIADGAMHPAGLVAVERAKTDGRWSS